jgi:hypothetical protein
MYGVENYRSPTQYEIMALNKLEVESYITGIFKRTIHGADIELHLCDIKNNSLDLKRSVSGTIEEDRITELREKLKELTKQLLEPKKPPKINQNSD